MTHTDSSHHLTFNQIKNDWYNLDLRLDLWFGPLRILGVTSHLGNSFHTAYLGFSSFLPFSLSPSKNKKPCMFRGMYAKYITLFLAGPGHQSHMLQLANAPLQNLQGISQHSQCKIPSLLHTLRSKYSLKIS